MQDAELTWKGDPTINTQTWVDAGDLVQFQGLLDSMEEFGDAVLLAQPQRYRKWREVNVHVCSDYVLRMCPSTSVCEYLLSVGSMPPLQSIKSTFVLLVMTQ